MIKDGEVVGDAPLYSLGPAYFRYVRPQGRGPRLAVAYELDSGRWRIYSGKNHFKFGIYIPEPKFNCFYIKPSEFVN